MTEEARKALRERLVAGKKAAAERRAVEAAKPATAVDINAIVQKAVAEALAQRAPQSGGDLDRLVSQLAITLGNYQNQFTGQQLVPAEILAERKQHGEEMKAQIDDLLRRIAAGEEVEWPEYRIVAKTYLPLANGDEIIEPMRRGSDNILYPTDIKWPMAPSLAMRPLNEPARHIYSLFTAWLGNQGPRDAASDDGRARPPLQPDEWVVTYGGRLVTGGTATQRIHSTKVRPDDAPIVPMGGQIVGQDPMRIHSGPPTKQVRVLGTIAPPAVQNG